jgi:hypothetical protein
MTVKNILDLVPRWNALVDWRTLSFWNTIGWELLDASFGINFSENSNSNSMLGAIENKIKEIKRNKCQRENTWNNSNDICPWNGEISNLYLPTPDELYKETVYLNQSAVKIWDLKDEFEYTVIFKESDSPRVSQDPQEPMTLDSILSLIPKESRNHRLVTIKLIQINGASSIDEKESIFWEILLSIENDDLISLSNKQEIKNKLSTFVLAHQWESKKTWPVSDSYTLQYKKNLFTLEEAKREIEKKTISTNTTFLYSTRNPLSLPCVSSVNSLVREECSQATANMRDITTAMWAYYSDTEKFPDSIDQLNTSYINDTKALPLFKKNFTYKNVSSSWSSIPDYEIRYIGKIGEGASDNDSTITKKDYTKLMSGWIVPPIPEIFSHIPSDGMALYVKNPANLFDLLNQKSNTSQRLSGLDVSESIKGFMKTFFELKDFEQIEKNLTHEMAIVVDNLDATAPDMVLILSEADRAALSPSAKARVVGSTGGFIFIANSKESLDRFIALDAAKSLRDASDFHFVWWKKSAKIQDAFVFVWDAFFEKMLSFETYLSHYRKYRDYKNLWGLQDLVWAYGDAFSEMPKSLTDLTTLWLDTLTRDVLSQYSLANWLVTHKNIWNLKSIKTLPEARYEFSNITKSEIEDYKYNVLKYRDIWRSSLDPMGIVFNRYGDGMEIDFFMTPIPQSADRDIQEIQKIFEWVTKDSFSFITNPKIRMWLLSFVWWFDIQKFQTKIKSNDDIWRGYQEFSQEVLNGKDIFDYLAWEFAFSIWNLDPDMLDGWNIEKIDVYGSVQVTSEEKGKELIDIIRTRILKEMWNARWDEIEMIKWFLAKPLIEDYNGKKIYYVEWLPIPFVGKIGFAYTFVDDFFIIGPNRSTIKNVIDVSKSWDSSKKKLLSDTSFERGTFFATLFDWVSTSEKLKGLYEKNKSSIPRYTKYLTMANIGNDSSIQSLLGSYYVSEDHNKRLWIETTPFSYTLWTITIDGNTDNLLVKINKEWISMLTGVTMQMWNNIESESTFPKEIMSEKWISLADFLSLPNIGDILALNIVSQLDSAFSGDESLMRNMTFALNMWDDEIGLEVRIFRNIGNNASTSSIFSQKMIIFSTLSWIIIILLGIGGILFYRRRWWVPLATESAVGTSFLSNTPAVMATSPQVQDPLVSTIESNPIITSTSNSIIEQSLPRESVDEESSILLVAEEVPIPSPAILPISEPILNSDNFEEMTQPLENTFLSNIEIPQAPIESFNTQITDSPSLIVDSSISESSSIPIENQ